MSLILILHVARLIRDAHRSINMQFDTSNYLPFGQNSNPCYTDCSYPNNIEAQYLGLLDRVMRTGVDMDDRTGTGIRDVFGVQMRQNLAQGFPLLTTKKVHHKALVVELMWILKGDTNIQYLHDHGVKIWDEWADEKGSLGPVYGEQWRNFGGVDQIAQVIKRIKEVPECRRQMVSAWNPVDLPKMKLAPCHALFQFRVWKGRLSCHLYQRSADLFLGVPFNIASYALLTHMIANVCDLEVGEFIWTGGSCHIYQNHFDAVKMQLAQVQRPFPTLKIPKKKSIFDFSPEDVGFENYLHGPHIPAPVSA